MPKLIIVGYDPGLTTAFAAVDLRGNFITAQKKKEWPSSAVAQAIRETGRPLIIAVDKKRASEKAEKFAARFGCRLWAPEKDLGVREKNETVKELMKRTKMDEFPTFSSHEKDAIAAAVFAYKAFAGKFSKIDDTLAQVGMSSYSEEVKRTVLSGDAKNINEALERIREKEQKGRRKKESARRPRKVPSPGQPFNKREAQLRGKIKDLERSFDIQKLYIAKLEKKMEELEKSRKQLRDEQLKKSAKGRRDVLERKEVQLRENMISNLQTELNNLKKVNEKLLQEIKKRDEKMEIVEEGGIVLVPVAGWDRESLAAADRAYNAKDKILWIRKFSPSNTATKYCIALHPKAVVMDCDEVTERKLRNADIAVLGGAVPQMRMFYASIDRNRFERALKGGERGSFLKWLKEYRGE